jgi:AcrR family transcriptional regulator
MATRNPRTESINIALHKGRKTTQRERILAGMVLAANRDGYAGATVTEVIAAAGVSRPTFYEYFADRDECFLAALAEAHEQLARAVTEGVAASEPARALAGAVAALVGFAAADPARARLLMHESLGGGPAALERRDRGIRELAALAETAERAGGRREPTPDLPTRLVIGAAQRMLAARLRRGLPGFASLEGDLLAWLACYETPAAEQRWRGRRTRGSAGRARLAPEGRLRPPPAPAPGRARRQEVAESHRQRLFYAAARVAGERGYAATTIAAIAERAGLDRRAFYSLFKDKREVYMAMHESGLQRLLGVTAGAFFAGASWPERVWEGTRGLAQFIEENPTFATGGFVDAQAVGPGAVQRVEDGVSAFTVFLQEGFQYEPRAHTPPRLVLEAIVTAFYELVYEQARGSASPRTTAVQPLLAFICLAPFLGAAEANAFIEQRAGRR